MLTSNYSKMKIYLTLFFGLSTYLLGNCMTVNFNKETGNICSGDTLIFDVIIKANKSNYIWKLTNLYTGTVSTVGGNSGTLILNGSLPETANGSYGTIIQVALQADSSNNTKVFYTSKFILVIPTPRLNLGAIKFVCPGSGVLIDNIVSPGTYVGVTYRYEWYLVPNTIISTDTAFYAFSGGKYFVKITEYLEICSAMMSVVVDPKPKPIVSLISNSGSPVRCADKPLILEVPTSTGSNSFTNLIFSGPNRTLTAFNKISIEPTTSVTYKAVATNSFGCKDSSSLNISINPPLTITSGVTNATLCKFTTLPVNAIASGGSVTGMGYTYSWLPTIGLSNPNIPNPSISPQLYDGINYTVTGTDAAKCTAKTTVLIKKARLELSLANFTKDTLAVCSGSVLDIIVTRKWGQPNFTFTGTSVGTPLIKITDTTYTTSKVTQNSKILIQVKDDNNCIDKDSLIVNIIPSPVPNIGNRNKTVCINNSLSINITPTITGSYTYKWSPNINISNSEISNPIFKPASSTTQTIYNVTIIDNMSQCITKDSLIIDTKESPKFKIKLLNEKAFVETQLTLISETDEKNINYNWRVPGKVPNTFNSETISLQFDTAKVYEIILIGNNTAGCIKSDTLKLRVRRNSIVTPYIPNIFIPTSSDTKNNSFRLFDDTKELDEMNFSVKIFNISGQVVYQTESYNEMTTVGWKGDGYSTGVYTYLIKGIKVDDTEFIAKGGVTLLR